MRLWPLPLSKDSLGDTPNPVISENGGEKMTFEKRMFAGIEVTVMQSANRTYFPGTWKYSKNTAGEETIIYLKD